jgi:hypothetical protein
MPQVRFEPSIPVFERAKDGSCLGPRGHCERLVNMVTKYKSTKAHLGYVK